MNRSWPHVPPPTNDPVAATLTSPPRDIPPGAWRRLALYLAAAQCLALLLLGVMLLNKHRSLLTELTLSRIEVQAWDLDNALRTGTSAGLRPDEMQNLGAMVERLKAADPAIAAIEVYAVEGQGARVAFAADPGRVGAVVPPAEWRTLASARGFRRGHSTDGPLLETAIRDEGDEAIAALRLRAHAGPLAAEAEAMAKALWPRISAAMALMTLASLAAMAWVGRRLGRRKGDRDALRRRAMAVALATILAAGAYAAWHAGQLFGASLRPAVTAKTQEVASFLAAKVVKAEALGIPLDQLPGVADYFADIMKRHPEIAALRLTDGGGRLLAETRGRDSLGAWQEQQAGSARVSAADDEDFIAHRLGELATDLVIVLLVAMLVFRELLGALMGALPGSNAAAGQRLQSLRLPLFLLILTEEMSRAFLPLYINGFIADGAFLGRETQVGLPIAVYMLCFALATPFAGRWSDRWGVPRVFAAGVGLTLAGFAWTALATSYWELLPARALCAWGYATGTMACQRQLILLSGPADRARGLALFVGAVGIAAICGSALGGVLADQIGFRPVFAVSALLALLAWIAFRLTRQQTMGGPDHAETTAPLRLADVLRLLRDRRFAALMLGAAIPAKIALAGFLFYLTPLAMHQLDFSAAATGRAVMTYFILVAAINPVASWLSDRYGWRLSLTVAGGTLIGLGGLAGWLGRAEGIWLGIAALGIGTGLATAPMQALASEIGARAGATSVAVVLRTLERLGSVIGPLWAGIWLAAAGWGGAMAAVGLVVLAGTLLCLAARERSQPS